MPGGVLRPLVGDRCPIRHGQAKADVASAVPTRPDTSSAVCNRFVRTNVIVYTHNLLYQKHYMCLISIGAKKEPNGPLLFLFPRRAGAAPATFVLGRFGRRATRAETRGSPRPGRPCIGRSGRRGLPRETPRGRSEPARGRSELPHRAQRRVAGRLVPPRPDRRHLARRPKSRRAGSPDHRPRSPRDPHIAGSSARP